MLNICSKCNKPLEEGDRVKFNCLGVYHSIPSTRMWAVDKNTVEADVRSIQHLQCNEVEGD